MGPRRAAYGSMGAVNVQPVADPLAIAALDAERHVAAAGWDQPPRLFALVRTADLLAREPHLREQMGTSDLAEGALSAVEQEGLPATSSLETLLGRLAWPPEVDGCAFAIERMVVPPDAERDLPERPEAAVDHLAAHPDRAGARPAGPGGRRGGRRPPRAAPAGHARRRVARPSARSRRHSRRPRAARRSARAGSRASSSPGAPPAPPR